MFIDWRSLIWGAGATLLLGGCSSSGGGGDGGDSSKFNLGKWRLQLPVNDNGGLSGSMKVVNPAKTVRPWFVAYDDRLEFVCPAEGATSGGTTDPRTELAENNDWVLEEGGVMAATLVVTAIPSGSITVGQVWASDQPLHISVLADGRVRATGEALTGATVGKITIGQPFSYRVEASGYTLKLFLNGALVWLRDTSLWKGRKIYFKAGTYCHAAGGTDPKAQFKAIFTDLTIAH